MAADGAQVKPITLFYSYSHRDEDFQGKLETHLAVLRRGGLIAEWHDRKIEAGDEWREQIDRHLRSADIVLLLVSADFIASDYCWGEEMNKALARHRRGEARVIPVILRYCRWRSTPLAELQAVPRDGKPIKSWPDEDEAFDQVVAAIEAAVQKARQAVAVSGPVVPEAAELERLQGQRLRELKRPSEQREADEKELRAEDAPSQPGTVFRDVDAPWCPEMVVIPPGEFMMGFTEVEKERPQHPVRITHSLAVGRYPVTFEEYDHFARIAGREPPRDEGWGRGRRPVINVSWDDAQAYVEWLSAATRQPYRLLSEAEWEHACRAGTATRYSWGEDITPQTANYGKNLRKTSKVGSYPANSFRLLRNFFNSSPNCCSLI